MKRIPQKDLDQIELCLSTLEDLEEKVIEIKKHMTKGTYDQLPDNAFFYALKGLKEGKIEAKTVMRISDIEGLRRRKIEFEVFDPVERFLCGETVDANLTEYIDWITGRYFSEEELPGFVHQVKNMPKEDRLVMRFKPESTALREKDSEEYEKKLSISQYLETVQGFNIFSRHETSIYGFEPYVPGGRGQTQFTDQNSVTRISVSNELFTEFLTRHGGINRVQLNPVFGKSTVEQIKQNGLTDTRDVAHEYLVPDNIGGFQLKGEEEADGFSSNDAFDFKFHDWYHAMVTSSLRSDDRRFSIQLEQSLEGLVSQMSGAESKDAVEKLSWVLKDMDYPRSFIEKKKSGRSGFSHFTETLFSSRPKEIKEHAAYPFVTEVFEFWKMHDHILVLKKVLNDEKAREQFENLKKMHGCFESMEDKDKCFLSIFKQMVENPEYKEVLEMLFKEIINRLQGNLAPLYSEIVRLQQLRDENPHGLVMLESAIKAVKAKIAEYKLIFMRIFSSDDCEWSPAATA